MGEVEIYRTGLCASKLHYSFLKVFFFPFKIYNIFLDFVLCTMFQIPFKMTHCVTNGWHLKLTWHFHIYTNERNLQDVIAYNLTFSNSNKTRASILFFLYKLSEQDFYSHKKNQL